ncbi:hypothetical protein ES703_60862 [subsurface metagenome]
MLTAEKFAENCLIGLRMLFERQDNISSGKAEKHKTFIE